MCLGIIHSPSSTTAYLLPTGISSHSSFSADRRRSREMSSSHLQWLITRNTSSFILKKRNVKQPFSREPLHLTNRHCYKYNTLIHKNVIGVEPAKDKNGFMVVMKSKKKVYKPKASMIRFQIKSGPRHSLAKLRNIVKSGYRKDCRSAVLKKASAIIRSEKTRVAKKAKTAKKAE